MTRAADNHAAAHPGHQRVFRQRAVAVTTAVTVYGWHWTARRHLDTGITTGPCALCRNPTTRYGPAGSPLCSRCQPHLHREGKTP